MPAPAQLGNYQLLRLLARGGMADVYLAQQTGLERTVAIKVLSSERACDPDACSLFCDEARVAGMLSHQNLAAVYDVAVQDGAHYLAMEFVDGADVREIIARAQAANVPIPYAAALTVIAHAAAALDYAHQRCDVDGRPLRLVHRDISLSNIMVTHEGCVKVIDFGIASSTASVHHTNAGIVRGKASYMAPEQCLGGPIDQRTDVFALGIVLYELVTGQRCFQGASDFERMLAVVSGTYVPPTLLVADLPASLEQVISTALAIDPGDRYASAAELIDALDAVATLEGWTLGEAATAAMMSALFDPADLDYKPPASELPTVTLSHPRRLARGTEPDLSDWQDDVPTRGRPAFRRSHALAPYPTSAV